MQINSRQTHIQTPHLTKELTEDSVTILLLDGFINLLLNTQPATACLFTLRDK